MAESSISYATDSSVFPAIEALVLHNLPNFGSMGDGIINKNFLLSYLKRKKSYIVVEGGLEAWHGLMNSENSNGKWQAHTATMSANLQDPADRLRFPWKTFTSAIVINALHAAMNKGRAAVKDWSRTLTRQANTSIPNSFNSAFWATSPGANEPESVPTIISTTPTTGTIGGLSRASETALQNGYDNTAVTDLGAEDGIKALMKNVRKYAIGSGGLDRVDVVILSNDRYVSLEAYLASLSRYRANETMADLEFDTIKLNGTTISYENSNVSGGQNTIDANSAYGINSTHMFFKTLRDGNFKWSGKFERVAQTLNRAMYFYVFGNLTTDLPKSHFVMDNITG